MRAHLIRLTAAGLLLACAPGCAILRKGVDAATAPLADGLARSLQKQSDLQLVRDGVPAYLLLLDGLIESSPDNPRLLLAAADAQTAYAGAFVDAADTARAASFYARARDYGLRALCRNKAFRRVWDKPYEPFAAALPTFRKRDVPALYTTALAWAGWIISSPESMQALSELPKVLALMQRVAELEPGYQNGGVDLFYGIYYAVLPPGGGQDLTRSRECFERAIERAGPNALLPRVSFAEIYAKLAFDRALFEQTLKEVVDHEEDPPELRLMNAVARLRARKLLEQVDEYFD